MSRVGNYEGIGSKLWVVR